MPCALQVAALQGEGVSPAFFAALARVRTIHDNCRQLLRTHHQRAGLELMDLMAAHQESAYERLCRWGLDAGANCTRTERLTAGSCRTSGRHLSSHCATRALASGGALGCWVSISLPFRVPSPTF